MPVERIRATVRRAMTVAPINPAAMTRARTDRAFITEMAAIIGLEAARAISHGHRGRPKYFDLLSRSGGAHIAG
jgi:hypothetical protein